MISFGLQGHITLNLSNLYSIGFICWAIQLRGKTAMKLLVDFRYATGCEKWWISFSITLEPSGHTLNGILAEMISRGGCFFFFCVFFMLMQSVIGLVGCSWYLIGWRIMSDVFQLFWPLWPGARRGTALCGWLVYSCLWWRRYPRLQHGCH